MDQDKQTLLEAAKAFAADVGLMDWSGPAAYKLRDALIAAKACGSRECQRKVFKSVAEALS